MNKREKIMVAVVVTLFVVAGGYFGVNEMIFGQAEQLDNTRRGLERKLEELEWQNRRTASKARSLMDWARLTFDTDELRASAELGAKLVSLVERAGLSPEKLALQPVRGRRVKGAYREIGRTVRVRGKLQNIVDFLYLLQEEPHLHQLDNISITPEHKTNEIDLQLRFLTIVMEPANAEDLPVDQPPTTAPADLDSDERQLLGGIAVRDLFRPYIQARPEPVAAKPAPTPAPTPAPRPAPTPAPTPAPDPGRFRVVGLPGWDEDQKVLVSDKTTGQLRTYTKGDTLGGGTIAMVDYRPLPTPENPKILSPSRAILKIGPDYWAVELGQNLTQKRRLKAEQLPNRLRSHDKPDPDDRVKENEPPER